jgi:hypothetical protein
MHYLHEWEALGKSMLVDSGTANRFMTAVHTLDQFEAMMCIANWKFTNVESPVPTLTYFVTNEFLGITNYASLEFHFPPTEEVRSAPIVTVETATHLSITDHKEYIKARGYITASDYAILNERIKLTDSIGFSSGALFCAIGNDNQGQEVIKYIEFGDRTSLTLIDVTDNKILKSGDKFTVREAIQMGIKLVKFV